MATNTSIRHDARPRNSKHDFSAMTRVTAALTARGSHRKSGKWPCPAHNDSDPSLTIYKADQYAGVYLKCFAGCPEETILKALGLAPHDKYDTVYDSSSPARDAVEQLWRVPIAWSVGAYGRNQRQAYRAMLNKAHETNSLDIDYAGRLLAEHSGLTDRVAARTINELCVLGVITPTGVAKQGHGKHYRLVVNYTGPRLAEDIPSDTRGGKGCTHSKYKNLTSSPLTSYFTVCASIPPQGELQAWLRTTGVAVVNAMSRDKPKSQAAIIREAKVDRDTVRKVLRMMLQSNGLAAETPNGWVLTGDLASFDPGTHITESRRAKRVRDRKSHKMYLSAQAIRRSPWYDGKCEVCGAPSKVLFRPHVGAHLGSALYTEHDRDTGLMWGFFCHACMAERSDWIGEQIVLGKL